MARRKIDEEIHILPAGHRKVTLHDLKWIEEQGRALDRARDEQILRHDGLLYDPVLKEVALYRIARTRKRREACHSAE